MPRATYSHFPGANKLANLPICPLDLLHFLIDPLAIVHAICDGQHCFAFCRSVLHNGHHPVRPAADTRDAGYVDASRVSCRPAPPFHGLAHDCTPPLPLPSLTTLGTLEWTRRVPRRTNAPRYARSQAGPRLRARDRHAAGLHQPQPEVRVLYLHAAPLHSCGLALHTAPDRRSLGWLAARRSLTH